MSRFDGPRSQHLVYNEPKRRCQVVKGRPSMSDINTKILQDIPLKHQGHETPKTPGETHAPDPAEKTVQSSAQSNAADTGSGSGNKDQGQNHTYTVMITSRSGESRAISMNADSPEEAKSAAASGLDQDEQILSVSESSVQQPSPDRGLIA